MTSNEAAQGGDTGTTAHGPPRGPLAGLVLGAMGVVFGDIGTSPLYALREIFNPAHGVAVVPQNVYGALSLVFWALLLMVTLKYVLLMMAADNRGEGGIMALLALSRRLVAGTRARGMVATLGLLGAAMFYGDSMITPAISVLSAVEGLEVAAPALHRYVVPIALLILTGLFIAQRGGTARVAAWFGPITALWFAVLAVTGIVNIAAHPSVLGALSPHHALAFCLAHGWVALVVLGAVVLVITGGEALYADMGHFGKRAIRLAWLCFVLPALVLNYFGQGALILEQPDAARNPFYLMVPAVLLWPLIVLATAATIIASQAVISGAFSLTRQAMQIDFCPRIDVIYTSARTMGQIYVPVINWLLFGAVVCLVLVFGSSSALASAYGLAVTATMLIDTLLFLVVARRLWAWSVPAVAAFALFQLALDGVFLASTSLKIEQGGWFPLLIGASLYFLLSTWQWGRAQLRVRRAAESIELEPVLDQIAGEVAQRVPGTAIFFTTSPARLPRSLLHNLKHNKVLHERVVLLTLQPRDIPYCSPQERVAVEPLRHGFYRVLVRFGFMDPTDLPLLLRECRRQGLPLEPATASYFLSRETIIVPPGSGFGRLRQRVFAVLSRLATSSARTLNLPINQVLELGTQLRL